MDLVTAVNWPDLVDSTIPKKAAPPLIGLGQFIKKKPKKKPAKKTLKPKKQK